MKLTIRTSLRRPEERFAARQMADALLRADRRRARTQAMPKPAPKKAAPTVAGPQPIRLADLKRAFAARERLRRTERRRHPAQTEE
jgi:hypothetical protein